MSCVLMSVPKTATLPALPALLTALTAPTVPPSFAAQTTSGPFVRISETVVAA